MAAAQPDQLPAIRREIASLHTLCASIDELAERLSEAYQDQVDIIKNAVSAVRVDSQTDLESFAPSLFVWDKLPGEVKNQIYKLLLVSDEPINPYVCNPGVPSKRWFQKHGLQGQVLRLSKTIYQEALPILLSDNTFVLTNSLDKYLGFGLDKTVAQLSNGAGTPPPDRANMVHRVVLDHANISHAQMTTLRRFKSLRELIFVSHGQYLPIHRLDDTDWEATCAGDSHRFHDHSLVKYARKRGETKVYLVCTQRFYGDGEVSITLRFYVMEFDIHQDTVVALKWRLKPDDFRP